MSVKHLELPVNTIYDNDEYMKFIEDNLAFFMKEGDIDIVTFEPAIAYKHEGDLYGLFRHLNIPVHLHYLTMRINGYETPYDFNADVNQIYVYKGGLETAIAKALSARVR